MGRKNVTPGFYTWQGLPTLTWFSNRGNGGAATTVTAKGHRRM
ncbi:MAG: hypothetical protein OEV41_06700 [Gammaproteobacteria bacterium]|nr:hypothetical protein [Gammaproteobacteria bacterium]